MESHKDVHKQDLADISNKFKTIKRNNKPKSSEDLTVSAEKSSRDYFNTRLNELNTKVWALVFCFQNFSNILWGNNCFSDCKKILKFLVEEREFANFWDH